MNPSRNQQGQPQNNHGNNFQPFFPNSNYQQTANNIQEEDQMLLQFSEDNQLGQSTSRKTPFKTNSNSLSNPQNNVHQQQFNFLPNQANSSNIPPSNQSEFVLPVQDYEKLQKQKYRANVLQRASKIDESLMLLLKEHDKKPQTDVGSKIPSKIEQKSKKALNRLSHQLFPKNGGQQEIFKAKKSSRKTVSTMNLDYRRDFLQNEEKGQPQKEFQKPSVGEIRSQKIGIEVKNIMENFSNMDGLKTSPEQKIHQSQNEESQQNRISETKARRSRLSAGMEGLSKFLKVMGSQKKEKKPSSPPKVQQLASKANSRVTMDMNSLLNFLSKQNVSSRPSDQLEKMPVVEDVVVEEKAPEQTKFEPKSTNPLMNFSEAIIMEDEHEDDVTPVKNGPKERFVGSIGKIKIQDFYDQKQLENIAPSNLDPNYCTKWVYENYFCHIDEMIGNKRKELEDLNILKNQETKEIANKLAEFTITAEKIAEWKDEEQRLRERINAIKQKVNKAKYDQNCELIYKFQQTFGIQLHRLQKTQPEDGFFIEFTYDDCMYRIYRNPQKNETQTKFLERFVPIKSTKGFEFAFDERSKFIQLFNSKKQKTKNIIEFMVQFTRYVKAIEMLEATLAHYSQMGMTKDHYIDEKSCEISLTYLGGRIFEFKVTVDIISLLEDGGIRVQTEMEGEEIELEIPIESLKVQQGGNKLINCFMEIDEFVSQTAEEKLEATSQVV